MPSVELTRVEPWQSCRLWPDKGRREKEVLGRPNLYVTTDYFLDYMGINHLEELPVIDELEIQAQESQLFGERIEEDENQ